MRNIKLLHPDAKIPYKKNKLDAGYDCYLIQDITIPPYSKIRFSLGFAIDIKSGQMLTVRSRSSTKMKGLSCAQTTCDAGYTGELYAFLINHTSEPVTFLKGQRAVQLVFVKLAEFHQIVEGELDEISERGKKGFGSSGMN